MPEEGVRPPQLPDYELLSLVGRGSYGEVWLARGVTGVFRAIKIVWRHRFADADPFEREFRGVRLFAGLSIREPRLLAVFHVGRNDEAGFFYYVMEPADDATAGAEIDPENYSPRTLRTRGDGTPTATVDETIRLGIAAGDGTEPCGRGGVTADADMEPATRSGAQAHVGRKGVDAQSAAIDDDGDLRCQASGKRTWISALARPDHSPTSISRRSRRVTTGSP